MGKIFFIADLHFDDENIILYENRPVKNSAEMNNLLINRWNNTVSIEDTVYVLGDFCENAEKNKELLDNLKGTKILVKGNHDTQTNSFYRQAGFSECYDIPVIFESYWILSHEPLYVNENMPYANIFGHVHNSPIYKDFSSHHFCVSAERINYIPISFEDIKRKVSEYIKNEKSHSKE